MAGPVDNDYLIAWDAIVARLKDPAVGIGLAQVGIATDLASVYDGTVNYRSPAAFVVFSSDLPISVRNGGQQIKDRQDWLIVLAVRDVRDTAAGQGLIHVAGPILARIRRALQGWAPVEGFTGLTRTQAPRASYTAGEGFFPSQFYTEFVFSGDNP